MSSTRVVKKLAPQDNVQHALDHARPGDEIVLSPGTYYQDLTFRKGGSEGSPVKLSAATPGEVTLHGGPAPDRPWPAFQVVQGDLFRAEAPHRAWWLMADGRNLVNYGTLDNLQAFSFPNPDSGEAGEGVPEGFAWEDGTLYLRLAEGRDPREAEIEVRRPGGHTTSEPGFAETFCFAPDFGFSVPGSGYLISSTLANVVVAADHVAIEGLRLHMGGGAAVVVHGNHVAIRDCLMSGAHLGVLQPDMREVPTGGKDRCATGFVRTARGLTVERCEFSGYPLYQWVRRDQGYWGSLYHSSMGVVFMNYGGPRSRVRHNWLYECFDGLEPRGNGTSSAEEACDCSYNLIQNCADDSIEFDSRTAMNLRLHHNVILDGMCLLALSPVMGGGLTIDHNIVYVSPEHGLKSCALFKMGSPWGSGMPTQGCRIEHNTLVNRNGVLYWCGDDHRYLDNVLENNIFWVPKSNPWGLPGFEVSPHNLHCGPKMEPDHLPDVPQVSDPGFLSFEPADFHLRPDSPAVRAGAGTGDGSADLGAIALGEQWTFPRPGPGWATDLNVPERAAIPDSLPRSWVGLE